MTPLAYAIVLLVGVAAGYYWSKARRLQRELDELWDVYAVSQGWTSTPPAELVDEVSR